MGDKQLLSQLLYYGSIPWSYLQEGMEGVDGGRELWMHWQGKLYRGSDTGPLKWVDFCQAHEAEAERNQHRLRGAAVWTDVHRHETAHFGAKGEESVTRRQEETREKGRRRVSRESFNGHIKNSDNGEPLQTSRQEIIRSDTYVLN